MTFKGFTNFPKPKERKNRRQARRDLYYSSCLGVDMDRFSQHFNGGGLAYVLRCLAGCTKNSQLKKACLDCLVDRSREC